MASGAKIVNRSTLSECGQRCAMKASRKPKPIFNYCLSVPVLLLVLVTGGGWAHSGEMPHRGSSGEVKTYQQLRSLGQSAEQYRSKVLAENMVMMAKTASFAPAAVTEVYGRDKTQVVAPTNATYAEPMPTGSHHQPEINSGWSSKLKKLVQSRGFQRMVMGNFMNTTSQKWLPTGNDLWDGLLQDCWTHPSLSCMQKNMYTYLDRTLLTNDVNVTDNFLFIKNTVNYTDALMRANEIDGNEDLAETGLDIDLESQGRSAAEDDTTDTAGK